MPGTAVLLIDAPDRKGLVASVAGLLYRHGANITHADQHQDPEAGLFFMRVEWTLEGFDLAAFHKDFGGLASELQTPLAPGTHVGAAARCRLRLPAPALPVRPPLPPRG